MKFSIAIATAALASTTFAADAITKVITKAAVTVHKTTTQVQTVSKIDAASSVSTQTVQEVATSTASITSTVSDYSGAAPKVSLNGLGSFVAVAALALL